MVQAPGVKDFHAANRLRVGFLHIDRDFFFFTGASFLVRYGTTAQQRRIYLNSTGATDNLRVGDNNAIQARRVC